MKVRRINKLFNSGYIDYAKQILYCVNNKADFVDFKTGEILLTYEAALGLQDLEWGTKNWHDAINIIHADNSRYNRLFKRIKKYLDMGQCWFLTLTFTDDVLNSTNDETRRKYVRRFLKEYSNCYIANIDFGKKTDREHYHAVILIEDGSFIQNWSFGYSSAYPIKDNKSSSERISKYMLKIANHFVKKTVKRNKVIYSIYRDKWVYKEPAKKVDNNEKIQELKFWENSVGGLSTLDYLDLY